ncbi:MULTISPECIES: alpha/beta hydrolase [unclassified Ruegeria]|uniref:alpha/beta hydrolase n=1 Tax=unclassified Ruegeria TaxID=2625375 RepID=UPI0014895A40|nr:MULTISPECIES: alpha/beta fold hydrolase [unclassified Ruegeria]NOC84524.1 alpha/beta fold hydrolase [Ruegeria sp. HKCCD6428]NOC91943.1 alpha/beta fold hydrolase [Ruegeria sp. HKCCD6604]
MNPEQIFAVLSALLGEPSDPTAFEAQFVGGADTRYPVEITPCSRPVVPDEIDGETVICGIVAVPEDHRDAQSRTLDLSFIVFKAHSLAPVADPVVYLHGGPGGGSVESVRSLSLFFDHLRGRRDVVAFDQRGVDASAPDMDCFGTLAKNLEPIVDQLGGADLPQLETALVRDCISELTERGFDLPQFNTTQNALDVRAVMSALGYAEYNIYGVSYGTKLALEVMRSAPAGVRAVVLDSVAPPQIALYDTLFVPHTEAIFNTFAPCEADPVCAEAYPDITQRYFNLLEDLEARPLEAAGIEISGQMLFSIFSGRNDWSDPTIRGFTTYAPALVRELEDGTVDLITQIINGDLPPQPSAETLLAGTLDLSADEKALAQAAINAMSQMEIASDTASSALEQLEADRDRDLEPASLGEFFDDALEDALAGLPDRADRLAFAQDYLNLRFETPRAGALLDLVRAHFNEATAGRLASLIALLGPEDVERVFNLIATDNAALQTIMEGEFELLLYACQEDFVDGFNSAAGFGALVAELGYGPLMTAALAEIPSLFADCSEFTPIPRDNYLEPVLSDIAVLVLSGEIDTQTASSWGGLAADTLHNSQSFLFPETGHGALVFSQCARDIGEAFLENPGAGIDSTCVSDLRLPYLMPDGSLHSVEN